MEEDGERNGREVRGRGGDRMVAVIQRQTGRGRLGRNREGGEREPRGLSEGEGVSDCIVDVAVMVAMI